LPVASTAAAFVAKERTKQIDEKNEAVDGTTKGDNVE